MTTHKITLPSGVHVVFNRRPTAADVISIEDDPQSQLTTQKPLLFVRASIARFGDKQRAPYLSDLLKLKRADRESVIEGYTDFLEKSLENHTAEWVDASTVKLAFGLTVDEGVFDVVTLCDKSSELTGYEECEIERNSPGEMERTCILVGMDIAKLSQSDGDRAVEGPLGIDQVKILDALDLNYLIAAVNKKRSLFRRTGKTLAGIAAE